MGKKTIIEIDRDNARVIRSQDLEGNWWKLEGKCNRCGVCCEMYSTPPCPHLTYKQDDGDKKAFCLIHKFFKGKPWGCIIYPRFPEEANEIPECGYTWTKE